DGGSLRDAESGVTRSSLAGKTLTVEPTYRIQTCPHRSQTVRSNPAVTVVNTNRCVHQPMICLPLNLVTPFSRAPLPRTVVKGIRRVGAEPSRATHSPGWTSPSDLGRRGELSGAADQGFPPKSRQGVQGGEDQRHATETEGKAWSDVLAHPAHESRPEGSGPEERQDIHAHHPPPDRRLGGELEGGVGHGDGGDTARRHRRQEYVDRPEGRPEGDDDLHDPEDETRAGQPDGHVLHPRRRDQTSEDGADPHGRGHGRERLCVAPEGEPRQE